MEFFLGTSEVKGGYAMSFIEGDLYLVLTFKTDSLSLSVIKDEAVLSVTTIVFVIKEEKKKGWENAANAKEVFLALDPDADWFLTRSVGFQERGENSRKLGTTQPLSLETHNMWQNYVERILEIPNLPEVEKHIARFVINLLKLV